MSELNKKNAIGRTGEDMAHQLAVMHKEILNNLPVPVFLNELLDACDAMAQAMYPDSALYLSLHHTLSQTHKYTAREIADSLASLQQFMTREQLEQKLRREFNSLTPFTSERVDYANQHFEKFAPLGVLGHILPANDPIVGVLSVIEGLLAQNINLVKLSSRSARFPQRFFEALFEYGPVLKDKIYLLAIASEQETQLKSAFSLCDALAVWGSQDAVDGAKSLVPSHTKVIDWGPKISFAYLADQSFEPGPACDPLLNALCEEICLNDQLACSAPQVVFLDTQDKARLTDFGQRLAQSLETFTSRRPPRQPSLSEASEIALQTKLNELEQPFGHTQVIQGEQGQWRVFINDEVSLQASPLYRTIWVKPLPKQDIIACLRPHKAFLQTLGLACQPQSLGALSEHFLAAGVTRINQIGQMQHSYTGAPHDGRYALRQYTQKISLQLGEEYRGLGNIEALAHTTKPQVHTDPTRAVMSKADFQAQTPHDADSDLVFKSGGSTGKSKLSHFAYDDYHRQMHAAALGLYASGFEPEKDRAINLFFGGELYGGFISFFSVLEKLKAKQFPMSASDNHAFVADFIIAHKINTLLGMPSYLFALLSTQKDKLIAYGGIEKIFYGGEHFNQQQTTLLTREFGIKDIRSAAYGSVDAGPLGFQCQHCTGAQHHLHHQLHELEILQLDKDTPVQEGEIGRLVVSVKHRKGQAIKRYEIGDLGRWLPAGCECGRPSPRFELLGRHGDIFRIASYFFNYQLFSRYLQQIGYAHEFQLCLEYGKRAESITLFVDNKTNLSPEHIKDALLSHYPELDSACDEQLLEFYIEPVSTENFRRTQGSGKLHRIIDEREVA